MILADGNRPRGRCGSDSGGGGWIGGGGGILRDDDDYRQSRSKDRAICRANPPGGSIGPGGGGCGHIYAEVTVAAFCDKWYGVR